MILCCSPWAFMSWLLFIIVKSIPRWWVIDTTRLWKALGPSLMWLGSYYRLLLSVSILVDPMSFTLVAVLFIITITWPVLILIWYVLVSMLLTLVEVWRWNSCYLFLVNIITLIFNFATSWSSILLFKKFWFAILLRRIINLLFWWLLFFFLRYF